MTSASMRDRFVETTVKLLSSNSEVVLVLAEISKSAFNDLDLTDGIRNRIINVGIREQLMVGVAAGLAKEGFVPIVHTYAPFLVERAYEQLKLDFGHQGLSGVFISIGASYDAASSGRTHQAPADVSLIRGLPDWNIFVPGHTDEVEEFMRHAVLSNRSSYIRLSEQENDAARIHPNQLMIEERNGDHDFVVIAVGPTLDPVLSATDGLDLTVLYAPSIRPFDADTLKKYSAKNIVLVEPYLAGTSSASISSSLIDRPHRLLSLGVKNSDLRKYGEPSEHAAAHGLDAIGLRKSICKFYGSTP
jgi:transketolase